MLSCIWRLGSPVKCLPLYTVYIDWPIGGQQLEKEMIKKSCKEANREKEKVKRGEIRKLQTRTSAVVVRNQKKRKKKSCCCCYLLFLLTSSSSAPHSLTLSRPCFIILFSFFHSYKLYCFSFLLFAFTLSTTRWVREANPLLPRVLTRTVDV